MTQTNTKKIIAGLVSFAMVFGAVVMPAANADAQTTTTSVYARDLTVGSRGADVTNLQAMLNAGGFLAVAPTGYFGSLTKAALMAWQASVGISPASGYFGPITRAYIATHGTTGGTSNVPGCAPGAMYSSTTGQPCTTTGGNLPAGCTSTSGYSSTTGVKCSTGGTNPNPSGLDGTDGSISDVNELSQFNNEEVGEGEDEVKVLGFEVEASNDGDIAIRSIKVSFDPAGNGSSDSDNLDDYISGVKVWMGDEEVASADVDDFTEDDNNLWTRTITLKSNVVVNADDTEQFYVTVDGAGTLDSGDIDSDSWTVDLENIRFVDGSGVTTTETGYEVDGMDVPIEFVTFSAAADTELQISTVSSSPEAGIVVVDDSDDTDNVTLLKGELEVEGSSDVTIDEFPVSLTAVGNSIVGFTGSLTLVIGGETFTETVATSTLTSFSGAGLTASLTFDNLDFTIDAGDTVEFTVKADINDIESPLFAEGNTLLASVTASNREVIDAENEEGDQLTSSERSGTATGEAQEFRTSGIALSLVSVDSDITTGTGTADDNRTFTIRYKITAVGENAYVSSLADVTTAANTSGYTSVRIERSGTATSTGVSAVITNVTDTDLTSVGNFLIEEGSANAETFEVTALVTDASGLYRAVLNGVRWGTTDIYPLTNSYTSNLDSFVTPYYPID